MAHPFLGTFRIRPQKVITGIVRLAESACMPLSAWSLSSNPPPEGFAGPLVPVPLPRLENQHVRLLFLRQQIHSRESRRHRPWLCEQRLSGPDLQLGMGQLGANGIDAALYSGSKCYFFSGKEYIRVTRGVTGPGTVDPGYPAPICAFTTEYDQCPDDLLIRSPASSSDLRICSSWRSSMRRAWPLSIVKKWAIS